MDICVADLKIFNGEKTLSLKHCLLTDVVRPEEHRWDYERGDFYYECKRHVYNMWKLLQTVLNREQLFILQKMVYENIFDARNLSQKMYYFNIGVIHDFGRKDLRDCHYTVSEPFLGITRTFPVRLRIKSFPTEQNPYYSLNFPRKCIGFFISQRKNFYCNKTIPYYYTGEGSQYGFVVVDVPSIYWELLKRVKQQNLFRRLKKKGAINCY